MSTDAARLSINNNIAGAFIRKATKFHSQISCDGRNNTLKAEPNRYHLYVSKACPWCHRVLIVIALKGLQNVISITNTHPYLRNFDNRKKSGLSDSDKYIGWEFTEKYPDKLFPDNGYKSVWDIYKLHDPSYTNEDRLTVPILFDTKTMKIVNNESSELIEIFNSEFNEFADNPKLDLSPKDVKIQQLMKKWNDEIYANLNDGVYRAGFAKTQKAYNNAYKSVFCILDKLDNHLANNRYLCGDIFTLSDIRAFVTLLRFDSVYYIHFKCNYKQLRDYKNVWNYTRDIYQMDGVKETVDIEYTKIHYFHSHRGINPTGIVPNGPYIDFNEPHGRDTLLSKL